MKFSYCLDLEFIVQGEHSLHEKTEKKRCRNDQGRENHPYYRFAYAIKSSKFTLTRR